MDDKDAALKAVLMARDWVRAAEDYLYQFNLGVPLGHPDHHDRWPLEMRKSFDLASRNAFNRAKRRSEAEAAWLGLREPAPGRRLGVVDTGHRGRGPDRIAT